MATGFHGFHVFVGTIALFISFIRVILNHFTNKHHFGFESAIWYWHFVDGAGAKHVTFCYFIYFAQRASVIFRFHACELPTSSFRLYNSSILSAQKAVISNRSMVHVYQKRNKTTYEIKQSFPCCDRSFALLRIFNGRYWTEGLGEYRIQCIAGSKSGTLYMRTSRGYQSAAGEARKYFSTLSGEKDNESAVLTETKNKFENIIDEKWITNDNKLFERAVSIDALKRAWYIQKSKQGMMTKGSGEETLNSISDQWFITTNKKLLEGSFKYPNRRRVLIDKQNGGTRPLTIANPRIKIIERALLNALEPHFEGLHKWVDISESEYETNMKKKREKDFIQCCRKLESKDGKKLIFQKKHNILDKVFLSSNYGFRSGRSAHEALHDIKHWRTNTTFLIDYDVSKAFDNVNRRRLKNLFTFYIKDSRFWLEISKMLNAGVILELKHIFEKKGVAQGSIISPFLFNIYMHELDKKVDDLRRLTSDKQKSYESATYGNLEAEQSYRQISRDFATDNLRRTLKKYGTKEAVIEARRKVYKEHHDKYGRRKGIDLEVRSIQYARYADDFLIGIVGSREYASQVRKDINNFIKGNLHLKVKKDNIIHRNENSVKFLGYMVGLPEFKAKTSAVPKSIRAARKHKRSSIARFTAADKRLARAKSYEFQANILKQVRSLAQKMKVSISSSDNVNNISCILAYKELTIYLIKELKLDNWKQLVKLLHQTDLPLSDSGDNVNAALKRWTDHLQIESDRLNEFAATILRDKISSLIKSKWSKGLPEGISKKIEVLQSEYLNKADDIIKECFNEAVEEKRNRIIKKFNINMNASLNKNDNDLLELGELLALESLIKSSPRRVTVNAPIREVFAKLRLKGYIHPIKDRAVGNVHLKLHSNAEIIRHYNSVIHSLLQWFSGAGNLPKVKGIAQLLLKSCALTLANKHKKNLFWVYNIYGSDIKVSLGKNSKDVSLVTRSEILNSPNKFNLKTKENAMDHFSLDKVIGRFHKLDHSLEFFVGCCVEECNATDNIEVHHIRRLHRRVSKDGKISVLDRKGRRVKGLPAVLTSINRKQLPLCHKHHLDFEAGKYHPLDYSKLNSVLNRNSKQFRLPMPKDGDFKSIFDGLDYTTQKKSNQSDQTTQKK